MKQNDPTDQQALEILIKALADPAMGRMAQDVVKAVKAVQRQVGEKKNE